MIFNRQLESFLVVARSGSLSQASNKLYITPAALTQQMNLLEASLGFRLFERSNKGMRLTPAGEALNADLEPVFSKLETAISRAEAISRQEENELCIGYHLEDDLLPFESVCTKFHSRCPKTQLSFKAMPYEAIPEAIRAGNIDLGIMYCPERIRKIGLSFNHIMMLHTYVWVPPRHPLATKTLLHFSDLRDESLLLPIPGDVESADALREYLKKNEPKIRIGEMKYDGTLALSCCIDNSLLLLPKTFGKQVSPMIPIPLAGKNCGEVGFVCRKTPSHVAKVFMEFTSETIKDDDTITV